jgi:DnaJ-class molecular chaperone
MRLNKSILAKAVAIGIVLGVAGGLCANSAPTTLPLLYKTCRDCKGLGKVDTLAPCHKCKGKGVANNKTCKECNGKGHEPKKAKCTTCGGSGKIG